MDSKTVNEGIQERIASRMVRAGMSKRQLSLKSGIPLTTLDRRMTHGGDWLAREVLMVAQALNVSFLDLLPRELRELKQVAA